MSTNRQLHYHPASSDTQLLEWLREGTVAWDSPCHMLNESRLNRLLKDGMVTLRLKVIGNDQRPMNVFAPMHSPGAALAILTTADGAERLLQVNGREAPETLRMPLSKTACWSPLAVDGPPLDPRLYVREYAIDRARSGSGVFFYREVLS